MAQRDRIEIRPARTEDRARVAEVVEAAFDSNAEVELIERLAEAGLVVSSLVATCDEDVLGHVLFSELPLLATDRTIRGASLAPLAVRPDCQRQGIGKRLTRAGLNACRLAAIEAVVVLGDPGYYSRLGFSAERASHIESRWSGEAFMALELVEGALESHHLIANYPAAFLELQ